MKPPETPRNVSFFIDRHNYTQNFLKLVLADSQGIIDIMAETEATYGTGKTTILSDLFETVHKETSLRPVWMSLNLFSLHYRNPALGRSEADLRGSSRVYAQNYVHFHQLVLDLCQTLFSDHRIQTAIDKASLRILRELDPENVLLDGGIDQWLEVLNRVDLNYQHGARLISNAAFQEQVEKAVNAISEIFLNAYNADKAHEKSVVFADDYCWIYDQPIGDWVIGSLTQRMQNTVVIVSHTELEEEKRLESIINPQDRTVLPLRLTDFTPEEVGEYLEKRLDALVAKDPSLPDKVYLVSRGHAQTVCLLADLLEYTDDGNLQLPEVASDATPGDLVQNIAHVLISRTNPSWIADALQYGALVHHFDGALMHTVLLENPEYRAKFEAEIGLYLGAASFDLDDVDDEDEAQQEAIAEVQNASVEELLIQLERYSFVRAHSDDLSGVRYSFHSLISGQLTKWLQETQPEKLEAMHGQVASYYGDLIASYEEQDADTSHFIQAFKYEDPVWQSDMREWLYHLSMLTTRRDEAQRQFISIYILALQWWHWYIRFPFSDTLITQLEATQFDEDAAVVKALRRLHKNFPHGYFNEKRNKTGWNEVIAALEAIMTYMNWDMDAGVDDLDEDEVTTFCSLLEQYGMAHRFKGPEPDYAMAEQIWKRAIELTDDEFNISYFNGYLAEMYLEMERYDEVLQAVDTIDELIGSHLPFDPETDYEVLSLSNTFRAQVALKKGDWETATEAATAATLCAFANNFVAVPNPPDPYTVSWQQDIGMSLFNSMVDAAAHGHELAIKDVIVAMKAAWQPYYHAAGVAYAPVDLDALLAEGDARSLYHYVMPPQINLDDPRSNSPHELETTVDNLLLVMPEPGEGE